MILADKIIQERKKNGWSQEELADKLEVTRQSVSKWESAQSVPDLQRILQMSQLFGVSTDYLLKDEIEEKEMTSSVEDAEYSLRKVSMEEANAFLELKWKHASRIAWAVFMCIISPICLIVMAGAADQQIIRISENAAAGIGLVCLLLLVASAVAIFIFCGNETKEYEYLKNEMIDTEYGVTGMVKERKQQFAQRYAIYNVLGAMCCILGVLPIFIALIFTENDFIMCATVGLLLLIVAIGVMFFVKAGIIQESYEKLLQEGEYTREGKEKNKVGNKVGSVYWLIITAIYLAYSFLTARWEISWVVWPVAGVLFPVVVAIANLCCKGQ